MKRYPILLGALLVAAACSVKEPAVEVPVPQTPDPETIVPGTATILFSDEMLSLIEADLATGALETRSAGLNDALRELGIVRLERVFPDAGEYEERSRREGLHRFYDITFDPALPVTRAMADLSSVPGVEAVEPHRKIALRSFNDPYLSRQWHYVNTYKEGADINVQAVWDQYTVGSSDVIVSVVDEGVCYTHPDLKDNFWDDGNGHHGYNFVKNNYNISWTDRYDVGHGTHVAGTISAVNNNGIGVCGVAGGDAAAGIGGVRVMSCQIFDGEDGCSDSACGRAIKWGADHGAVISQNSWGFYADENEDGKVSASELAAYKKETIPSAIKAAIDYFIKYAGCDDAGNQRADSPMKGGLVLFAAGNENIDYDPICAYDPVIAVGAFGASGAKASYSNYGDWVDLGAPGGDGSRYVMSTLPTNIATSGYGGSGWMGTSMACPHASGVAALLVSYYGGQGFTADRCKELLLEGAVDGYFSSTARPIGRKVDALGSFELGGKSADPDAPALSWTGELPGEIHRHETVEVSFSVTDPTGGTPSVTLTSDIPGATLVGSGQSRALRISGPDSRPGSQVARIQAQGSGGTSQLVLNYVVLENHEPMVTAALGPFMLYLSESKSVDLESHFSDADGETLAYRTDDLDADVISASLLGSSLTLKGLEKGEETFSVVATDFLGASTRATCKVVVKDPNVPVDVYPQPTSEDIYIRIDAMENTTVEIFLYSATGAKVLTGSEKGSVFNPVKKSLTALSPGRYLLVVKYGGKTYKQTIVKG